MGTLAVRTVLLLIIANNATDADNNLSRKVLTLILEKNSIILEEE